MQSAYLIIVLLAVVANVYAFVPTTARGMRYAMPMQMAKAKAELIGKSELVDMLKEKTGVSKKDIAEVLGALTETVKDEVLTSGKEIRLRDFGTFKQKVSKPRTGRNPRTGEELQISGSKSVAFSASATMKVKTS